jgi:hypothetical protein
MVPSHLLRYAQVLQLDGFTVRTMLPLQRRQQKVADSVGAPLND